MGVYVGTIMTDADADLLTDRDDYLFDLDFFYMIYKEIAIEPLDHEMQCAPHQQLLRGMTLSVQSLTLHSLNITVHNS